MTVLQQILRLTARGQERIACPLCEFEIHTPAILPADAGHVALGTLNPLAAQVRADQATERAAETMRAHLAGHDVLDWLPRLTIREASR